MNWLKMESEKPDCLALHVASIEVVVSKYVPISLLVVDAR